MKRNKKLIFKFIALAFEIHKNLYLNLKCGKWEWNNTFSLENPINKFVILS